MPALQHSLVLPTLLLAAATSVLLSGPARSAEDTCDRRLLPRNDTLSVEAAARAALGGGKPQEIRVSEACIHGVTTFVTLTTPQGEMLCERERSAWYKRGGWKCAPEPRRAPEHRQDAEPRRD